MPEPVLKRAWEIQTYTTLTQTYTDNAKLTHDKSSELFWTVAPGIKVQAATARLKGQLDYSRQENLYASNSGLNSSSNSLNAQGVLETVDDFLFVEGSARIARQTISAFGVQSAVNNPLNKNQTETLTLQMSPYIQGKVGDDSVYEVRYRNVSTQTKANLTTDSSNQVWSASLRNRSPWYGLSWTLSTQMNKTDYDSGYTRESDLVRADFNYRLSPQLQLLASVGQEKNDFLTADQKAYASHSFGFDWALSDRTRVSVSKGEEYYGSSHSFNLDHRTPLSAWHFGDNRTVTAAPGQTSGTGSNTAYDVYYALFAAMEPDPVRRDQLVRSYLQSQGIPLNQVINSGFLSSSLSLMRRQDLSFSLIGARNTVTVTAQRIHSERAGASTGSGDAFANASVIDQRGGSINWTHRLSPDTNLAANLLRTETKGSDNTQKSTLDTLTLSMSTRLASRTNGTISTRHARYSSPNLSYKENAVIGMVSIQY